MIGALMSVMALSTFAQKGERIERTPEERAAMRAEKMKTALELTDEQTKKVEAAFLNKMNKSQELRTKHAEDKETLKKEMRPVHKEFKASIKNILSDEQYAKWQELKKNEHRKGKACHEKCNKSGEKCQKKPSDRKQNLDIE